MRDRVSRHSFSGARGFQCANHKVLETCSMYACKNTQLIHVHINTFKATKDIAAGQELFFRYGSSTWCKNKNISITDIEGNSLPLADIDYASTMWRPELHPLPCRRSFSLKTGADGRHSFAVLEAIPPGTVLETSRCVEVSVIVVDQFPFLWDFVLTGETENEHTVCQQTSVSSRANTPPVSLQIKAKEISGHTLNGFCVSFLHSVI